MNGYASTLENLKNVEGYLASFHIPNQSAAVELLISKTIACMFHLPFYNSENDDSIVKNKVVWNGKNETSPVCGSPNGPDTNIYARNFDVLLEVTRRTEANQWKYEFGTGLRHFNDYLAKTGKTRDEVYLFLVAPEIYVDTYNSIRQRQIEGDNFVLWTFSDLLDVIEACNLTIGLRHVDIVNLMETLSRCMLDNDSFEGYARSCKQIITDWRKAFLRNDRLVFLGVKGYKVFKEKGADMLYASDIFSEVITEKAVKQYFEIIGEMPKREDICAGMLTLGFAFEIGRPMRDPILSLADELDIQRRIEEILESVKRP